MRQVTLRCVIFSIGRVIFYALFVNILNSLLSEIISETLQIPIRTFLQPF